MALSNYFYHGLIRKYTAAFGSMFNDITIEREEEGGKKKFIVPIAYGPWQKFLSKKLQDPKHNNSVAVSMPRIAFEIVGMSYDHPRKIPSVKKIKIGPDNSTYAPVPYKIEFSVNVMAKYLEDVYKVQEQIIPFFSPEYTLTLKLVEGMEPVDVQIVLNAVSIEDAYEGDFETRRAIIGTMNFTMDVYFYTPVRHRKVIKFIDIDINDGTAKIEQRVFDKNDIEKDYKDVQIDDDWGIDTMIIEDLSEDGE